MNVDASLVDTYGKLLFLSLWSRDTAIQEFLTGISLANEGWAQNVSGEVVNHGWHTNMVCSHHTS